MTDQPTHETIKAFMGRIYDTDTSKLAPDDIRTLIVLAIIGGGKMIAELGEDAPVPTMNAPDSNDRDL